MKKDETFEEWVKENYGFNPSEKDVNFMMHRESWDYQQNKIQDLEEKLARAVEVLELWQAYSDGFAYDDRGNHRSEKDIYEEVEQTLAQIGENGERE